MADFNALNPVDNISTYHEYATNHGYKVRPEFYYDKQLLDTIKLDAVHYVFYRVAETKGIQNGAEKLQLRRWSPLKAHTTPLVEGVPPQSDKGAMESFSIDTHAYGRFMEFSDRVDFEMFDPVVSHFTKEYSLVALETLDLLAQDALNTVGQAYYAGGAPNFDGLSIGDVPVLEDLREIVNTMKKQLVKPRNGNRYHVIGTPDFYFDMINDPTVEKYMTINQTTKGFYDEMGPIPPMFGMEFYESQAGSTDGESEDGSKLIVYRYNTNTAAYQTAVLNAVTYKKAAASNYDQWNGYDASYIPDNKFWDIDAYNASLTLTEQGYGVFKPLTVNRVYILGKDALIRTEIAGQGNAKMYVKPLGSAGVLDPIDQRQSIGFKINSVGFGNVRPEAVVIYYCVPTQSNLD